MWQDVWIGNQPASPLTVTIKALMEGRQCVSSEADPLQHAYQIRTLPRMHMVDHKKEATQ
eukprot:14730152-Ditylum_brightwellii.AAC.1